MKNNILLKTNLLVSVILLVGFALIATLSYRANYNASLVKIKQVSSLASEGIYYRLSTMLTKPVNISQTMAHDSLLIKLLEEEGSRYREAGYQETIRKYLDTYKNKYAYDSVFLVSASTNNYYNFNGLDRNLVRGEDENVWYYNFLQSGEEYSLNIDNDEVAGAADKITLFVNCRIRDASGRVIGVVGVGVNVDYIKGLLQEYEKEYDVATYLINEKGEIDRLILSDVTGDLWEYAALDGIQAATDYAGSKIDEKINEKVSSSSSTSSSLAGMTTTTEDDDQKAKQTALDVRNILLPSTSDVLYGLVDGSIVSTTWNQLTGSTDRLAAYVLKKVGNNVGGVAGNIIDYFASGANYVCYVNGKQVTYTTSVKYPVIAGGVAIGKSADGKKVNAMVQLSPVVVDKLGAGWVMKGDTRYETADDIQVYLWNQGTYYKVSLADLNPQDYKLIGWYDNQGHSAGNKIRLLVAVRTN